MSNNFNYCEMLHLPSLPCVALRLMDQVRNPETELREIVESLSVDPALVAKVLRAANSGQFGLPQSALSIESAVALLGPTVTNSQALSFNLTSDVQPDTVLGRTYWRFWKQSVVQSVAARIIGERINPDISNDFATCGLLLDIGRLIFLSSYRSEYSEYGISDSMPCPDRDNAEAELFGAHHAAVGADLMERWGLPNAFVEAIRQHHEEGEVINDSIPFQIGGITYVMKLASSIGDVLCGHGEIDPSRARMEDIARRHFEWHAPDLRDIISETRRRLSVFAQFLEPTPPPSVIDCLAQANELLIQLTVRAHVALIQIKLRQEAIEQSRLDLEFQNQQLQKQALHDPLTKVYNRHFFDETLENEIQRSIKHATAVGLMFVDVDHFKLINDTYGHQFGDVVLQQIARRFSSSIRASDVLARYGGEEFVILTSHPTERGIERWADRIRRRVEEEPFLFGDIPVKVTVSIGSAVVIPGRNDKGMSHRLVATADEALYEAKRSGRNRCVTKSLIDDRDRMLSQQVLQHRFSRWIVARKLLDIASVSRALMECRPDPSRLGDLAVELGYLNVGQTEFIATEQNRTGERFGILAVDLGWLTNGQLVHLLSLQQEQPMQLASQIIRLGLLAPDQVAKALEEYMASQESGMPQVCVERREMAMS